MTIHEMSLGSGVRASFLVLGDSNNEIIGLEIWDIDGNKVGVSVAGMKRLMHRLNMYYCEQDEEFRYQIKK